MNVDETASTIEAVDPARRVGLGPSSAPGRPDLGPAPGTTNRTSRAILLALLFAEIVAVGLLYVPIAPNPDQEFYDYMAWASLKHGGFYRNGGDMNMPGEPLIHLASMTAFGNHYWSYRLLDYLIFIGLMAGIALLCRPYYGQIFAGLFLVLSPIVYATSGAWMAGQRDPSATHVVLLAGFAYARKVDRGGVGWLILAGMAMGWAAILKPTFLAFGPILIVLNFLLARRPIGRLAADTIALGAVGASVFGAFFALGWATDSLRDWWEMTVTYSLTHYVGGQDKRAVLLSMFNVIFFTGYNWYALMAFAGLISLTVEGRREPLCAILAVIATVLISTLAQSKGFAYHVGGLFTVMSLLCAFYLTENVRLSMRIPQVRLRVAILSFPALLLCGGLGSKMYHEFKPQMLWYVGRSQLAAMLKPRHFDDVVEAAGYVRSATRPDETVWTNSSNLMINSLADRSFPGRLMCPALTRIDEPSPLGDRWRREIEEIFRDRPPKFIILMVKDSPDPAASFAEKVRPFEPAYAMTEALKRDYARDRRIGRFVFYRRVESPAAPSPG